MNSATGLTFNCERDIAPSAVIASYGFNRTVIYKWLSAAAGRGRGMRALRS